VDWLEKKFAEKDVQFCEEGGILKVWTETT
jgi:hypothetical protein